jgi:hypothetical protein
MMLAQMINEILTNLEVKILMMHGAHDLFVGHYYD